MNLIKVCAVLVSSLIIYFWQPDALGCNVCHSKNPKMVKMHEELEFKDCFSCHGIGQKRSPKDQKRMMRTDPRCIRCHKK